MSEPPEELLPITKQMATASRKIHKLSDVLVNARLVVLFTDRVLYARAIGCFWAVLAALEQALEEASSTCADIKQLWPQLGNGLFRTPGFRQDLEYYLGPSWESKIPIGKAMAAYIAHIRKLAVTNPTLLLAHSYTQHTALATGGQIIKRMAQKQMQLPPDRGVDAFNFKEPGAAAMRASFVTELNKLGASMSPEIREQMVQEHIKAFQFNNAIITEFRLGWWPFLRGLVVLVPPLVRVALLVLLIVGLLTRYWLARTS